MRKSARSFSVDLVLILLSLVAVSFSAQAQPEFEPQNKEDYRPKPVDVDFLFGYYEQDGNHSAVTGGIGTEELDAVDSRIVIFLPMDSLTGLSFDIGMNHYTSASTDAIDFDVSSASRKDNRVQIRSSYTRSNPKTNGSFHLDAGGSIESDYISASIGGGWMKTSDNGMRTYQIDGAMFFDTWVVIFPEELRAPGLASVDTDKRRSFDLNLAVSQVLHKRMNAQVAANLILQNGLLSTPFHRIYFDNDSVAIERLPDNRIKLPLSVHMNYFVLDPLIIRFFYRFYVDNFGIKANTVNLEFPVKIQRQLTIYPFYRFHHQSASDYFEPFAGHRPGETYFTSDFDLSEFTSHKLGIGIKYAPVIGKLNKQLSESRLRLRNIGLRYSNYWRTDGLEAFQISLNLGMQF